MADTHEHPAGDESRPDLADLGERARADEDTPSSGPFHDADTDAGTAAGEPLAGVPQPEEPPAYPDGSEEDLDG